MVVDLLRRGGRRRDPQSLLLVASGQELRVIPVEEETEATVAGGGLTLPRPELRTYYRPEGGRAYLVGLEPSQLPLAEHLDKLRTSVTLRSVFDYDRQTRQATNWTVLAGMAMLFVAFMAAILH